MKKLLTFSLAFMLAVLFNTNAIAQLSYDISPAPGDYPDKLDGPIVVTFTDPINNNSSDKVNGKIYGPNGEQLSYSREFKKNGNAYSCEYGVQEFIVDQYGYGTYVIEFDGIQHFQERTNNFEPLQEIQHRDQIKNQWCIDNNIPIIRIPYTHLSKITMKDLALETSDFIYKGE